MKKDIANRATNWEMRKEYDFSNVRPNKYAEKYAKGTNIVVIEPDLVEFFPNSESVNTALRALASIFPKHRLEEKTKKSSLINHATMA